jgi:hypothetical protein
MKILLLFLCFSFVINVRSEIYTVNCIETELNHINLYPCTVQIKSKQINGSSSLEEMSYFVRFDNSKLSEKPIEISLTNGVVSIENRNYKQNNVSKVFDYLNSQLDENIFQINI